MKGPQRFLVSHTSSCSGYFQAGLLSGSSANSPGGVSTPPLCPWPLGRGVGTQESPVSGGMDTHGGSN